MTHDDLIRYLSSGNPEHVDKAQDYLAKLIFSDYTKLLHFYKIDNPYESDPEDKLCQGIFKAMQRVGEQVSLHKEHSWRKDPLKEKDNPRGQRFFGYLGRSDEELTSWVRTFFIGRTHNIDQMRSTQASKARKRRKMTIGGESYYVEHDEFDETAFAGSETVGNGEQMIEQLHASQMANEAVDAMLATKKPEHRFVISIFFGLHGYSKLNADTVYKIALNLGIRDRDASLYRGVMLGEQRAFPALRVNTSLIASICQLSVSRVQQIVRVYRKQLRGTSIPPLTTARANGL